MKIARVFTVDYGGNLAGDIYDVFPADNHPGILWSGILKEVAVPDDFDKDIMVAVLEGDAITFEISADKVTAKVIKQKTAQIQALYDQMNADIFGAMAQVFGTTRSDSASAYYETWKLMVAKPELFSGKGFTVDVNMEDAPYMTGDPLETDEQVVTWASFRILKAELYSVYRMTRIEQFRAARAAILA